MARNSSNDIFDKLNQVEEEKAKYRPKQNKTKNTDIYDYEDLYTDEYADYDDYMDYDEYAEEKHSKKSSKQKNKTPIEDKNQKKLKNGTFLIVTYISVFIFLSLIGYLFYFNIKKAEDFISSPYNAKRLKHYGDDVIRGSICDKDGNVLAKTTILDNGDESREYPYGSLFAHTVGYLSQGQSGLEAKKNFDLLTSHENIFKQIKSCFDNKKLKGDSLITTLDLNLQQAAAKSLGSFKGAIVCMEPSTGKILAMYSNPTFEPGQVEENWDTLNSDNENSPLLNRATQGLYPPGSIFKTITALEYMKEDSNYNDFSFDCTGSIVYGDMTIPCYGGSVHGKENLQSAFANSCNGAFATIGEKLDTKKLHRLCDKLLFNSELPSPLETSKSRFVLDKNNTVAEKMMTCMGQGETMVSPYHMALITSAIANDGVLMKPHIISKIKNASGGLVSKTKEKEYKEFMTEEESTYLKELMKGVVKSGTAIDLNYLGYEVAAKTGTAEYSSDKSKSHSWFIGFSNPDNPDLVVSVVIEKADDMISATGIAKSIFEAYHN